jgi:hypothetical protein
VKSAKMRIIRNTIEEGKESMATEKALNWFERV